MAADPWVRYEQPGALVTTRQYWRSANPLALANLQESLVPSLQTNNRWGASTAYRIMGLIAMIQGDLQAAEVHLCRCLEIFTGSVIGWDIAVSTIYQGEVALLARRCEATPCQLSYCATDRQRCRGWSTGAGGFMWFGKDEGANERRTRHDPTSHVYQRALADDIRNAAVDHSSTTGFGKAFASQPD